MSKAARCRRIHARAIISSMPTPTNGCGRSCRVSWRPISRSLLGSADKARRDRLEWQIRRVEKRMAMVRAAAGRERSA